MPSCHSVTSPLPAAEASGPQTDPVFFRALIQAVIRCVRAGGLGLLAARSPPVFSDSRGSVSEHLGPAFTRPPLMAFTRWDSLSPTWLTCSVSIDARPDDLSLDQLPVGALRPAEDPRRRSDPGPTRPDVSNGPLRPPNSRLLLQRLCQLQRRCKRAKPRRCAIHRLSPTRAPPVDSVSTRCFPARTPVTRPAPCAAVD